MGNKTETKMKHYQLYTDSGTWLGDAIITSDGMFTSVTDYGNLSYAWNSYGRDGDKDFRKFLVSVNTQYFGSKMYNGISYISHGKKIEEACERFAEMILPALQKILSAELDDGVEW